MKQLAIDLNKLVRNHWSDSEIGNVRLVADFMQSLMNNHNFERVLSDFNNNLYLQHNRNIEDGFPALVTYIKKFVTQFPGYGYDVKHIYADGDFVIFHSHVTVKRKHRGNSAKGLNIIDTWRISDGRIVEHWDAIQPIDGFMRFYVWLNGGKIRNDNGLF